MVTAVACLQVLIDSADVFREVILIHTLCRLRREQLRLRGGLSRRVFERAVLIQPCLCQVLDYRSSKGLVSFRLFSVFLHQTFQRG